MLLSSTGRPTWAARSLHLDTGAPSSQSDTTCSRDTRRPLARVGGFLLPHGACLTGACRTGRRRSLKTQQRALETRPLAGFAVRWLGLRENESNPVSSLPRGRIDTLSSSSKGDKACRPLCLSGSLDRSSERVGKPVLHGEFDPGSGRTLAARLTHASRARTRPSGLGKAANG